MTIGIIGDFDATKPSHKVTVEALAHSAESLSASLKPVWIPTESLAGSPSTEDLASFDGFWCAPGSPYRSTQGALNGIRYARENNRPFLGS